MLWKLLGLQKKLDALFDDGWVTLGFATTGGGFGGGGGRGRGSAGTPQESVASMEQVHA